MHYYHILCLYINFTYQEHSRKPPHYFPRLQRLLTKSDKINKELKEKEKEPGDKRFSC